jgi:hypothetical protein
MSQHRVACFLSVVRNQRIDQFQVFCTIRSIFPGKLRQLEKAGTPSQITDQIGQAIITKW